MWRGGVVWRGVWCGEGCGVERVVVWRGLWCGEGCGVERGVVWRGVWCGEGVVWDTRKEGYEEGLLAGWSLG